MTSNGGQQRKAVAAAAALVLLARGKDVQHIPRLILDKDGSPAEAIKASIAVSTIFVYEKLMARLLRHLGLQKMPSTLAAMLTLFGTLRLTQKCGGESIVKKFVDFMTPGAAFLGRWFAVFLVPACVNLDKSLAALPSYGPGTYLRSFAFLLGGWVVTHASTAAIASQLAVPKSAIKDACPTKEAPKKAPETQQSSGVIISQEEATRRAYVVTGALGFLGASIVTPEPGGLYKLFSMLAYSGATIGSFEVGKTLPKNLQRVAHPLVISGVFSNLTQRYIGPMVPYMQDGVCVGDRIFSLLNAAVSVLGLRMYVSANLWYHDPNDFKCVLMSCGAAGFSTLFSTVLGAVSSASPMHVPGPLSLPMCHRGVMSALAMDGAFTMGPECDPRLAICALFIHGCLGASLGKLLLESFPSSIIDCSSPIVRGTAMGSSAHSIGTAGLLGQGDAEAAAIAGASMCLAGASHTLALRLPGVVNSIRVMAALAPR